MEKNKKSNGQEAPENTKSNKDLFFERIRAKYPGEDLTDEEAVYGKSMSAYDEEHDRLKDIARDNKALVDRLSQDPATASFVSDVMAGKVPPAAIEYIMANYNDVGSDPKYAEFAQNREADRARRAEIERMADEYAKNLAASEAEIRAFAEQEGMTEDDVSDIIAKAQTLVFEPLAKGKFTKQSLSALRDLVTMDEQLALANEQGYVKGRNEKIVEKKAKLKGDGLPKNTGAGTAPQQAPSDPLGGIGLRKDAFEMGGYKRR